MSSRNNFILLNARCNKLCDKKSLTCVINKSGHIDVNSFEYLLNILLFKLIRPKFFVSYDKLIPTYFSITVLIKSPELLDQHLLLFCCRHKVGYKRHNTLLKLTHFAEVTNVVDGS
jgi:hypothetical protein